MKKLFLFILGVWVSLFADNNYNISGGTQNFTTNNYHNNKEDLENFYFRLGLTTNSFDGESFQTVPITMQIFTNSMKPWSFGVGATMTVAGIANDVALDENGVALDTYKFYYTYELEALTTLAGDNDGFSINLGYIWATLVKDEYVDIDSIDYVEYTKNFQGFVAYINTPHLLKWGSGLSFFNKVLFSAEDEVWVSSGLQIIW